MFDPISLATSHWIAPIIVGAAMIDSINPCAFSILFLTITFLFSLQKDRYFILKAGGLYILGIFLVYTAIGLGVLQVLSILNIPNGLAKVGAWILIIYCVISIAGELFPKFPIKLKIPARSHQTIAHIIHKGSIPASLLLGVLVGLFEFPCTGGPYLFVLGLLHDQANFWKGFFYLILYNFVFVAPLIIILLISINKRVLEKVDMLRKLETKKNRLILLWVLLCIACFIIYI